MKKAILFGASGLIGSHLLQQLLQHTGYGQVTIVVRKHTGIQHPKLKVLIGDYKTLPDLKEQFSCDEVFLALGTTKTNTPDEKEYYRIDHDYPVLAATLAKDKGAKSVLVVSSVGANVTSGVFYIRTKGETERDIIAVGLEHTHIFRPSMLMGNRKEKRTMEKIFLKIWALINPLFVGKQLSKYKGIEAHDVAKAMISAANSPTEKVKIYHWKEMIALL